MSNTMTPQEIIDKVGNHLLTQGKPSERGGSCAYRGFDGAMCAAGCLLPDEMYLQEMEEKRWSTLVRDFPDIQALTDETGHGLITDLQRLHDGTYPGQRLHYGTYPSQWEDGLQRIVRIFNEGHPESKIHFTRKSK